MRCISLVSPLAAGAIRAYGFDSPRSEFDSSALYGFLRALLTLTTALKISSRGSTLPIIASRETPRQFLGF
jgi:hypothetical protein